MTVSSLYVPLRTQGNGTAFDFDFAFKTIQNVETGDTAIEVIIRDDLTEVETVQIEGTDYTVALNDNDSGTVTFTSAPAMTDFISILLNIPKTQDTNYINIGTDKFPADSHEGTVDKLTLSSQQADEESTRSVKLPSSSTLTNVSIPVSAANADNLIAVNAAGDDLKAVAAGDINLITASNQGAALILDETPPEARRRLNIWDNLGNSSGTDTYTASPTVAVMGYNVDQRFTVTFVNGNTGAATFDISDVGAEALEKPDGAGGLVALVSGDIPAGLKGDIIRDEADTKFILLNIANATETVQGVAEIATQAEVDAGTDDLKIVTPLKLANAFTPIPPDPAGLLKNVQTFTSSGTWFKPGGVDTVRVQLVGGGGGGADETVGGGDGSTGGTTSFGSFISGEGGRGGDVNGSNFTGGSGGDSFVGDIRISGAGGGAGSPSGGSGGGSGGSSYFGGGAKGVNTGSATPGINGETNSGGGGGGGCAANHSGGGGGGGGAYAESFIAGGLDSAETITIGAGGSGGGGGGGDGGSGRVIVYGYT